MRIGSRQSQANELLRVQQLSVDREHELAEDFRAKVSSAKQEISQIKRNYDEQLSSLTREHKRVVDDLQDKHQLDVDKLKSEMKHLFDVEHDAQAKFYAQTIEELKHEHSELLSKQKNQQLTQDELGQEYLKEKQQLEKRVRMLEDQLEQLRSKSQLELNEEKTRLEMKSDEYRQLQQEFDRYKSNFKATSSDLSDLHEQVREATLIPLIHVLGCLVNQAKERLRPVEAEVGQDLRRDEHREGARQQANQ